MEFVHKKMEELHIGKEFLPTYPSMVRSIQSSRLKAMQKLPLGAMRGRNFPNCRLCSCLTEKGLCNSSSGCILLLNN